MQDKLELFKRFNALFLRGGDLYKYNVDVLENISECVHVISGQGEVPGGAGVGCSYPGPTSKAAGGQRRPN